MLARAFAWACKSCGGRFPVVGMSAPRSLYDLSAAELAAELAADGLARVHARTLWALLYRHGINESLGEHPSVLPPLRRWLAAHQGPDKRFFLDVPEQVDEIRSREAQQLMGNVAAADQMKLQDVRVELARQQAAAAIEAGRYIDAERLLREAMVNAPASPGVRLDLARLYRKMGRDSDADSLLDSMVEAAGDGKAGGSATTEG